MPLTTGSARERISPSAAPPGKSIPAHRLRIADPVPTLLHRAALGLFGGHDQFGSLAMAGSIPGPTAWYGAAR
jgi:hypothetical protein